jgi:hypothetical protein
MNTAGAAIREGLGTVGDVVQDLLQPLADLNDAVGRIPGPWHDAAEAAEADALRIRQAAVDAAVQAALAANKTPDAVAAALREEGRGAVLQAAAETLGDPIPDAVEDGKEAAKAIARLTVGEIAEALRGGRSAWQEAVDQLGTDLENELTRSAEIAQIRAELAGDNIARGLASKDPIVKAQAEATRLLLTNRLAAMEADARHEGEQAGDSLAAGLRSRTSTVAAAAAALARAGIPNIGAGIGDRSGDMFGGYRAAGGPVTARRSYIVGERGPELFRPGVSGDIIPAHAVAALGESGGSQTINNNVTMHGVALRKRTPFEVAQEMERFERIGLLGGRPKRLVPDY